jgi:hypothetical protein
LARRRRRGSGKRSRPRSRGGSRPAAAGRPAARPQAAVARAGASGWRLHVQVYACAMLAAAATATGLILVLSEMQWQVAVPRAALAQLGVCLAIGIVLGLWVPRVVIQAHLKRKNPAAATVPVGEARVGFEFAASLAGLLLMLVAVLWGLLGGFVLQWEAYRGWLVESLLLPAAGYRLLLLAPLWVMVVVLGMLGTLVLVSLHGWLRLVNATRPNILQLWLLMLVAGLVAALVAQQMGGPLPLLLMTLLVSFAAAGSAVVHKPPGRARADLALPTRATLRELAAPLVAAGLVAAASAAVLLQQQGEVLLGLGAVAGMFVRVVIAWVLGVVLARLVLRMWPDAVLLATVGIVVTAAVWALAMGGVAGTLLVHMGAAATVVWAGRAATQQLGRVQVATAWIGTAVAGGYAVGMLVIGWCGGTWPAGAVALVGALVMTGAAACLLIFQPAFGAPAKVLGLGAVGAWLLVALGMSRAAAAETLETGSAVARQPSALVQRVCADSRQRLMCVALDGAEARGADLQGGAVDAVVLLPCDGDVCEAALLRVLTRVQRRLSAGGRLVLDQPAGALVQVALRVSGAPAYAVEGDERVLVFGRDVTAWLGYHELDPAGLRVHAVAEAGDWARLVQGDAVR